MIVRKITEISNHPERDVHSSMWNSKRLLLARDGMGFSLHVTVVYAGSEVKMHYKNHLEAVYCIEGRGTVEDLGENKTHLITPGTVYALNLNDRHILRPETDMRFVCVFNPPVAGDETHDADGAYPAFPG
ncbi:MAG: ectoine synthase [Nitrospinota bacterium]|nr:ectoine synthase [Nitrospinota bacterium]